MRLLRSTTSLLLNLRKPKPSLHPPARGRLEELHTGASSGGGARERSFVMVKPDGVQRGLVGDVVGRFERKGFRLVALKLVNASEERLRMHYEDLRGEPFFAKLISFMSSGPLIPMVWEGPGVVSVGRLMLGATNPINSAPGTIRGDFAFEVGRNVCHGSDSVKSAEKEIALWFSIDELVE